MLKRPPEIRVYRDLVIDNFAGGGGASTGIEEAIGRSPDIAINHDAEAIAMHAENHPTTRHYCEDVFKVSPRKACGGRRPGLAWFSPDCKHFSKAKGGKPVSKKIRGLAGVAIRWANDVKPRIIFLENVEEFQDWGPLDKKTGMPDPDRKGQSFRRWKSQLENAGYVVELRELRACDFGAPTSRKRLFIIARSDGLPIVWPKPTHEPAIQKQKKQRDLFTVKLKPYRTAAECIDWSVPCPSIFERSKPLAEATLRRIAKGIQRYVIGAEQPFIVPVTHSGWPGRVYAIDNPLPTVTGAHRGEMALVTPFLTEHANASGQRTFPSDEPLRTQCAEVKGGHFALVAPTLIQTGYGEREGQSPRALNLHSPLGTVVGCGQKHALVGAFLKRDFGQSVGSPADAPAPTTTADGGGKTSIVAAFMEQANTDVVGHEMKEPVSTIVGKGCTQRLVTSHLLKLRGTCADGQPMTKPFPTITAGGTHLAEVRAFLVKYYGNEKEAHGLTAPLGSVTTRDRFGLVTVAGIDYQIVDIGMRMLTPRELFRAQGFPDGYKITPQINGKQITKGAQVRMCGNSVCPPLAAAIVRANIVSHQTNVAATG